MNTAQLPLRELLRRPTSLGRMRSKVGMEEYLAGVWDPETARCDVPLFVQGVPVFLQEGQQVFVLTEKAMRIAWWPALFEVPANVEEEARDLERGGVKPRGSADVQSGAVQGWEPAIREADEAIRVAYDNEEPREALKTISRIWEHLDRASELAAARSRLLMGKVAEPPLAETPEWFERQEPSLRREEEGEIAANPLAVENARLLVRAALASVDESNHLEAEVDIGPLGRVAIDWQIPGLRLHWMVEATDLPWPSVKVYQVLRPTGSGEVVAARTQIFHNAFDVVDSFAELLRGR
jgi:hypothetical protein